MLRLILVVSCALVPVSVAQVPPPAGFEVASVRNLAPPSPRAPRPAECTPSNSPGRLTMCTNILSFVSNAYGFLATGHASSTTIPAVVEGGPAWIRTELYAINAKTTEPTAQEMMRGPMMQVLLEDRFKLKLHREVRQVPVYELTVKNTSRLAAHQQGNCTPFERGPFGFPEGIPRSMGAPAQFA
jgi:uncharacterized protein (TIGR03435 family)